MKKLDRAECIQLVMNMRNTLEQLLDVLMPEELEDGCPHPADAIVDESTLDDEGQTYRCTKCGATSKTPFPSITDNED